MSHPLPGFAWLVVSPALRQQFRQYNLPAPVRIPVRWAGHTPTGLTLVQVPAALSRRLALASPFLPVPASQLRPAYSLLLWAAARTALRRSLGALD